MATPTSSRSRDAALRRLGRCNRWLLAGSATLTGAFTLLAAQAFPGKTASAAKKVQISTTEQAALAQATTTAETDTATTPVEATKTTATETQAPSSSTQSSSSTPEASSSSSESSTVVSGGS